MSNQENQLIANRRAKLQARRDSATSENPVFPNDIGNESQQGQHPVS